MAREKSTATRNKILVAAREMFIEKGFDGTSVDEIAKKADITKSLLYYYFKSKDDVFLELMKSSIEKIIEKLIEKKKNNELNDRNSIIEYGLEILHSEIDVLRIALSEVFKTSQKTSLIFQLPATVFDEFKDKFDFTDEEKAIYCMQAIKLITYLSVKDKLTEVFGIEDEKIYQTFMINDYFI